MWLNSDVLFNLNGYHGGALVLYALRQKIGARAFWLYGTTTPPMPGHPDWTTNPVTLQAKALARAPRARPVP